MAETADSKAEPKPEPAPEPEPTTPLLKVSNYTLDGEGNTLQKKQRFNLTLYLENQKRIEAKDVTVKLEYPEGIELEDGSDSLFFTSIKGNEQKELTYSFYIPNRYSRT